MINAIPQIPEYERYKDSGIEWLKDIPEHWGLSRLKMLVSIKTGEKDTVHRVDDGQYSFFIRSPKVQKIDSYSYDGEAILTAGGGDIGKIFHYINDKFDYHQRVYKFSDFKKVIGKYLYYYLQYNLAEEVIKLSAKTTVDSLRLPYLQNFIVFIPSIEEQKAIAKFLDKKTALIDKVIVIKEKQIALLKEHKQIIIQNAVTKGLNPNTPMKDSGVEWIGDIPEHWKIFRLRFVIKGKLQYGANESGIDYSPDLPRYIRITDFSDDGNLSNDKKLSLKEEIASDYLLEDGDILLARSGSVGKAYQFKRDFSDEGYFAFAGYLIKARPNEDIILSDYLYTYTLSQCFSEWKNVIFNKVTIENIGANKYADLHIPIPSVKEQQSILNDVKDSLKTINVTIDLQQTQINKLKEYKASLINSAVTGKIKITQDVATKKPHNKAFEDAVIISVLVNQFSDDKFQINRFRYTKHSYLLHRKLGYSVENYKKKAAGPYNPTTRYGGGEKIALNKQYIKQVNNSYKGFIGGENIGEARKYFYSWFNQESLDWLEQFRYKKNDELGLITTIDKAMLEIRENNQVVNLQNIKQVLQENKEWKNKLNDKTYSDANITSTI